MGKTRVYIVSTDNALHVTTNLEDPENQGNIFVAASGQVTGSLPLNIGGTTTYTVFTAVRYSDSVQTLSSLAGTYSVATMDADTTTGNNPTAGYGGQTWRRPQPGRVLTRWRNGWSRCPARTDLCSRYFN